MRSGRVGSEPARILLVEDDAMVRGWVRLALEGSRFTIAAEAASGATAERLITRRRADVLLIDYRLPDGSGTELLRRLRRSGLDLPALVMSAGTVPGLNEEALEAGAQGTVLKTGSSAELVSALERVWEGETTLDARHPPRGWGDRPLTPRERQVLRLLAEGRTNREIAEALGIGAETAKQVVRQIFRKLGARRRADAVAAAYGRGLL